MQHAMLAASMRWQQDTALWEEALAERGPAGLPLFLRCWLPWQRQAEQFPVEGVPRPLHVPVPLRALAHREATHHIYRAGQAAAQEWPAVRDLVR